MPLAFRVIPVLLKRGDALVKGERFSPWRTVGVAEQAARVHAARGVDELILLDVSGAEPDFEAVDRLSECGFTPLTVGGGVRSVDDVRRMLESGADKVAIKSAEQIIPACAERFGRQAIVGVLDVSSAPPAPHAKRLEAYGAGEILLTSIEREGTMQGYDLDLIRAVCSAVSIPVVANGGCAGPSDMLMAIEAGASGCAAGALFQYTDWTPRTCSEWLAERGVEVRV